MEWINLIINVAAIFVGLFIYIGVMNTKWGIEHEGYQYAIMLAAMMGACLAGGLLRYLVGI